MRNAKNQSGYEPLNLENGSFVNSDNFDATDWNCWEIVQNPTVREYTSRCNSVKNIHITKLSVRETELSSSVRPRQL